MNNFKCCAMELVSERCILSLLYRVVEVKPTYLLLFSEIQSPKGHFYIYIYIYIYISICVCVFYVCVCVKRYDFLMLSPFALIFYVCLTRFIWFNFRFRII